MSTCLNYLLMITMVILISLIKNGIGEKGGLLRIKFLCFRNYGHLNVDGKICDETITKMCNPYFRICVSHQTIPTKLKEANCPVFFKKTLSFPGKEIICHEPVDNRGSLVKEMEIDLQFPLQEVYFVKVFAKDGNQESKNRRPIAMFSNLFRNAPYPMEWNTPFIDFPMIRVDTDYMNTNASLRMELSINCIRNFKTENCSNMCQSYPTDTYVCSNDGKKLCNAGRHCYQVNSIKEAIPTTVILICIIVSFVLIAVIVALIFLWHRRTLKKHSRNNFHENSVKEPSKSVLWSNVGKQDLDNNVYDDCMEVQFGDSSTYSHYVIMNDDSVTKKGNRKYSDSLPSIPI